MKKLMAFALTSTFLIACSASPNETNSNESINQEVSTKQELIDNNIETESKSDAPAEIDISQANVPEAKKSVVSKVPNSKKEASDVSTANPLPVQEEKEIEKPVSIPKIDFSAVYQTILTQFVNSSGKVDYKGLKQNKELVGQAIYHFQNNTPQDNWSKNETLSYWINAYNLFTLKLVMDNYPIKSIKDIGKGKSTWDIDFIELNGKKYSLNDIENNIIRKQFNEPRIHFAVNCASISCPKLLNKAYNKDNLNTLLDQQTRAFVNDVNHNTLGAKSISISNLFDWYKADFEKNGGVINFLNKYAKTPIDSDAKVGFKDYNWNLNEQ